MADNSYPPQPTTPEAEYIAGLVKDWSIAHGLAVRPPPAFNLGSLDPHNVLATTAPVTLFPSPFPKVCFNEAQGVQKAYNELYAALAHDEAFLKDIVEEIYEVDQFIADLWKVHLRVKEQGYVQNLTLGLYRSDYMVHQDLEVAGATPKIKQVEFNTIAASFGGLSSQTSELHKYLAKTGYQGLLPKALEEGTDLPENGSTRGLAAGLRTAYEAYNKTSPTKPTCVLFVTQDGERNVFDQRHLDYELSNSSPSVPVFRLPFSQVLKHTTVASTPRRELLYTLPHSPSQVFEVAVVYFRCVYDPSDFPDASSWEARFNIEASNAIKCPSILTQLAGCKKVQQVLATPVSPDTPSLLSKYVTDKARAAQLEDTFTNIYPLDDSPSGLEARKLALDEEKCKGYVLKPQREGGGNNIYRSNIPGFLKSIPEDHWKSFILMEIITPPPVHNIILRNGAIESGGVICELGVYGTCLFEQASGEVLSNETTGYLLRTKGDQSEEGGVAAGFGAMDSVRLV